MARRLPALLACLALLLTVAPAVRCAPRVGIAASAGRAFAAAARSVDSGGSLTVTGGGLAGQRTVVQPFISAQTQSNLLP